MANPAIDIKVPAAALQLDPNYSGPIFISDIDKTYLATQIDTLGGLLRAAFETAERKTNIPGFSVLLRAIRRGPSELPEKHPLFFLSASPPQMKKKIESKMEIDGVEHDGLIFKNQLALVRKADFGKIREHVGYKLGALLELHRVLPKNSKLYFFGDDSESDAIVFTLFAEIAACNLKGKALKELLVFLGVFREEALAIAWMSRKYSEPKTPLVAAFINLETGSRPSYYSQMGHYIFATENSLQLAFSLYERKLIRAVAVASVAKNLVLRYDFNSIQLGESLIEACRRGLFEPETFNRLIEIIAPTGLLPPISLKDEELGERTQITPSSLSEPYKKNNLAYYKRKFSDEGRY